MAEWNREIVSPRSLARTHARTQDQREGVCMSGRSEDKLPRPSPPLSFVLWILLAFALFVFRLLLAFVFCLFAFVFCFAFVFAFVFAFLHM